MPIISNANHDFSNLSVSDDSSLDRIFTEIPETETVKVRHASDGNIEVCSCVCVYKGFAFSVSRVCTTRGLSSSVDPRTSCLSTTPS